MKWWRMLRAAARATVHTGMILAPLFALVFVESRLARVACVLALLGGIWAAVWASFVYIPGFDPLFRVPWRGSRKRKQIAITFDDGPNGAFTEQVLELFRKHDGKATFFMVGQSVLAQPELARKVAAEGHAIGSHTMRHTKLHRLSYDAMVAEFEQGHAALAAAGLDGVQLFRAPHGLKTFALVRYLCRRGITLIGWTDGVFDTDCPSGDIIARRACCKLRPGEILLLHDGKQGHDRTVLIHALQQILPECQRRGLKLVTIPELLAERFEKPASGPSA